MELINIKTASMKENSKMMSLMVKENFRMKMAVFIKGLSEMEDFTVMDSLNGQMARNIEEITIMDSVKVMDSSSIQKIQAFRKEFGAKGC